MCNPGVPGDGLDPVVLEYFIPDDKSKVGEWKKVQIDFPNYDAAFLASMELPRISWGRIVRSDGTIENFGVEER